MRDSVIELENVAIERVGCTIQSGVNWRMREGEHWVVLGPNGSGKTTLAAMITGFGEVGPSAGRLTVVGDTYGQSEWQRLRQCIGVVSQAVAQHIEPQLLAQEVVATGRDGNLITWGRVAPSVLARARQGLRELGVEAIAKRPWRVLSQGERQRVLIARAVFAKPQVLLLDEPCAGLDPVTRENFLNDVQVMLTDPGAPATVLVTHHVEEIVSAITHALILGRGEQIAAGPIRAVLTSAHLSAAYGAAVQVRCRAGRWSLQLNSEIQ